MDEIGRNSASQDISGLLSHDYSENLVIFNFRNSKFDLKDNLVNNSKNSNIRRFLNLYEII